MRTNVICFFVLLFIVFCYAFGVISSRYAQCDPTPQECMSICVEEFEKMAA